MRALLVVVVSLLSIAALYGQAPLTIRGAATTPVPGWLQLASRDGAEQLWVAPSGGLTSLDIERAEQTKGANGLSAVTVVFTDDGANRMADLTRSQLGQRIAFVVDGKVVWAPTVRGVISKQTVLTAGAEGFAAADIQRILEILNQR